MLAAESWMKTISLAGLKRLKVVRVWMAAAGMCFALLGSTESAAEGIELAPLQPPPATGRTLFTVLPGTATGLQLANPYDDPRMRGDLYLEFEGGSIGTGVAIGDYDGDGKPDIFVVTKTKGCRLFRNLGGYRFEDVTDHAGVGATPGIWNLGATFVDINNSGRLDIYVCRFNAPNLLFINQGDGTFREEAHAYGLDISDSSVMAAFCDYDRDGWLDVYIATNILSTRDHPKGQQGYLFHNNRNGTFTNVTAQAGIFGEAQSHSATWWDYDNDGWPDLYVANDYGGPDKLYHNNGDGTFTDTLSQVLPHTSFSSMGADEGDVTNGGLIDLFVADMAATSHFRDQHEMAELRGRSLEVADPVQIPKYYRNMLMVNTGTGHFLEAAQLAGIAASDWTWSVRLEDLDNDGLLDLFVTNGFNRDPNPDIYSRAMHAESPAERIRILSSGPMLEQTHLAFRNLGHLQFEDRSEAWGLNQKGIAFGAALGDLGGDGNLDIVYTNYEGAPTLLRNGVSQGHRANVYLHGTVSNRFGVGAVVRVESDLGVQVRPLVLARGYLSSSEPMVHLGFGADTIIRRLTVTWPSGQVQSFTDLPVDRRITVTEPVGPVARPAPTHAAGTEYSPIPGGPGGEIQSREETVDDADAQPLIPAQLNRRGPALAVGAVDGSGAATVVVGGTTVDPLRVFRRTAVGQWIATEMPSVPVVPLDDGPVLLFDATGRGREDLLVTKGGDTLAAGAPEYQPRLYFRNERGGLELAPEGVLPPLPISAGAVAAADIDHSGRLAVFIGGRLKPGDYPRAPASALLLNRGGRFEDVTDTLAPGLRSVGMVTGALWSDVDGDGWPDLLLTLEWGTVRYFHNQQGRGFVDWTTEAGFAAGGAGWWTSIAAADFNGDGRPDFVVGNVGLNTPYRAEAAHPVVMFSGNFLGSESEQLIEGYYEGDRLYPRRSRKSLGSVLPNLLKRFPRNDSFARATLPEILGQESLDRASRFAATELRSGVFLSQPDGHYRFEPLPRIAQIAPLQGIAAGDFEGSGHADIYAVQNSYAPIPSVGRFDGGLSQYLRGDGQGHFQPVPPRESGLVVTRDAKALVAVDFDGSGWPDFLVSRNNDSTLAFHRAVIAGRRAFSIALRGPPGNPTAIGSKITVDFGGGRSETAETFAGAGYYSQSPAVAYFGGPEASGPATAQVRWPNGQTSVSAIPRGVSVVTLIQPGSPP